ncbi:hypothetical protein D9M71_33990 [compost metagenome]
MSAFYEEMADVALELIGEFGQTGTLTDVTPGSYDPVTGETTGDATLAQSAQMILLDYTLQESGVKYADGSQVQSGDKKILIAAKGLEWPPRLSTRVAADGADWQVVNVKEANPAGTPLVYELQGRR